MAQGAAFYFNMHSFNRKDITDDFPAQHVAYILNRNKVVSKGAQHAPEGYWDAQKWLQRVFKDATRKNARVWTRLILNLPYSLSHEERVTLVRDYLAELSQGRAQFVWAIHGDTNAPHAHVVFVDRDYQTNELVAKLSNAGSAYRLRKMWEDACNRMLRFVGSEHRISRWGKESAHHREINERARLEMHHKPHLASTALTPNTPTRPVDVSPEPVKVQETPQEASMELIHPEPPTDIQSTVQHVLKLETELRSAQTARAQRQQATLRINALLANAARINKQIDEANRLVAEAIKHQNAAQLTAEAKRKKLSWFSWGLSKVGINTRNRRAYHRAARQADMLTKNIDIHSMNLTTRMKEQQRLTTDLHALEKEHAAVMALTEAYGTDAEIQSVIDLYSRSVVNATKDLTQSRLHEAMLNKEISEQEYARALHIIQIDLSQGY